MSIESNRPVIRPTFQGKRATPTVCMLVLICIAAASCTGPLGPLGPSKSDLGERIDSAKLDRISAFKAEAFIAQENDLGPSPVIDGPQHPLLIEDARAYALANNLDLQVARIDPQISAEALAIERAAFEAVFVPSVTVIQSDSPSLDATSFSQQEAVSGSGSLTLPLHTGGSVGVTLTESSSTTDSTFATLPSAYSGDLRFSLSHPLLRNAGRKIATTSIRIASYNEQIVRARTKLTVIAQLVEVERAYWNLYAAQREREVRQQQHQLATAQRDRAQRLVDAGDAAEVEILRADEGVAQRQEAIIVAQNAVRNAQRSLKRLMNVSGLEMSAAIDIEIASDPAPVQYSFRSDALLNLARTNRMELLQEELALLIDAANIERADNAQLPSLDLDMTYTISALDNSFGGAQSALARNDFESWTIGVRGSIPIGNEAAKAGYRQAILSRLQRLATTESREQTIEQEVLTAIDAVDAAWQRILAARQSVVAATRTWEAEQRQFDAGVRTSTDVLDAAARLADAQSSEIRALVDYRFALLEVARSTGTVLGAGSVEVTSEN